jgi:hypothetical protein
MPLDILCQLSSLVSYILFHFRSTLQFFGLGRETGSNCKHVLHGDPRSGKRKLLLPDLIVAR